MTCPVLDYLDNYDQFCGHLLWNANENNAVYRMLSFNGMA